MVKLGPGGKLLLIVMGLGILAFTVDRYVGRERVLVLLGQKEPPARRPRLSSGDFPAGAAAPVGDLAALLNRPVRLTALPRGSTVVPLVALGGVGLRKDSPLSRAYGIEGELTLSQDEGHLAQALVLGGEHAGADAAIVTVDRLPAIRDAARDAKLKAVMLVSWSRGHDAVAAVGGVDQIASLKGRKVAIPEGPGRFFLFWHLAQAGLSVGDLGDVRVKSATEAALFLREGRVEAAAGIAQELAGPAKERGGRLIATTADAPFLIADVLVVRSEFLARYPDSVRRLVRGLTDAGEAVLKDPTEGAKLLGASAPLLDTPPEAIKSDPPATLAENLAFFGLRGNAPVRFDELYASAAGLLAKLGEPSDGSAAVDARELGPLLSAIAPTGAPGNP